jgi:hypothetical protein
MKMALRGIGVAKSKKKLPPQLLPCPKTGTERLALFQQFLHARRNAASQPLTKMFGVPVEFPDQWFRLSWLPFTCASEEAITEQSSWERAWHWTKFGSFVRHCIPWDPSGEFR